MTNQRFNAIETASNRKATDKIESPDHISRFYGVNVFDKKTMKAYLPNDAFKTLEKAIAQNEPISMEIADAVAAGMKTWALGKGVTHYTHWFQPLTGATAEKHDAFFDIDEAEVIEKFKGSALAQQEPDASSFPSGGLRETFEARGYTAWDPSSPAFIIDLGAGKTLCIPTIFVSYTGDTLDYKAPLLKALKAVDEAATAVCQLFDPAVKKVNATLGPEQEYFVIDKAFYYTRPDLIMTKRTLFGSDPAKHQQLDDHYFGSIPSRVRKFIIDFEVEALKLGIPVTTRHNEVAPSQFECAPIFEDVNVSVDHNQLMMDVMDKVAERHDLKVLFHEKPFANVNGTGKHNNWSLGTDTGQNLLSPGDNPKDNLLFLTFFVNVIKAVHENEKILRASVATAGNDHRLGANEAPPAIISVFIGSQLTKILEAIENNTEIQSNPEDAIMKLGIDKLPPVLLDNTDRNRTSPFCFTGNKFEYRAAGGAQTCAMPMTILNAIVAEQLKLFKAEVDKAMGTGKDYEAAILSILREYIKTSWPILFEGDNYSDDWVKEAEKRGLSNMRKTPEALESFYEDKAKKLLADTGVFKPHELEARLEVAFEHYATHIEIEANLCEELVNSMILPAVFKYQKDLIESLQGMKSVGLDEAATEQQEVIQTISDHIKSIRKGLKVMQDKKLKAEQASSTREMAKLFSTEVQDAYTQVREDVDALELMVDDQYWPLPKYREMLFIR